MEETLLEYSDSRGLELGVADSCLLWTNKKSGWEVVAGAGDVLQIENPGTTPISYRLVLLGLAA